jgi:glycosyltransferase involved in cell wall biosynthesis
MRGAMDLFLLPSLYEGLPLVGIEAQAAGLPLVVADTVTSELEVIPALMRWISLAQPASQWADGVLELREASRSVNKAQALSLMENGPFTIQRSIDSLEQIYAGHA